MSAPARKRLDELVRRVAPEQLERVVRPLFARFEELARENARVSHQIERAYGLHDAFRLEIRELAHELGIEDPLRAVPLPSVGMADRVGNAIEEAAIAAQEELRKCRSL